MNRALLGVTALLVLLLVVTVGLWSTSEPPVEPSPEPVQQAVPATPLASQDDVPEGTDGAGDMTSTDEVLSIVPLAPGVKTTFTGDLSEMRKRGFIRVLVTASRTDFFVAGGHIKGIQAALAREFLKSLNRGIKQEQGKMKLLFIPVTFDQLLPALEQGQGDIAAAMLTVTPERSTRVDFISRGILSVNEIVVTHRDSAAPNRLEDLTGRQLYVLRSSSYAEHLRDWNDRLNTQGLAELDFTEADPLLLSEDILEMVNAGVVDATVIDDYKGQLWRRVLPDIRLHESIVVKEDNQVGWAVRKDNPELKASLEQYVGKVKRGSLLGNILFRRYFDDTRWIENPLDDEARQRYAQFVDLFRKYGERYGFDHLALVAQAFRESGLDPKRRSHRGAIGLMQVLPSTAKDKNVGIPDIKDVEQNIHAGTKYLAFLRDRYFSGDEFTQTDRLAFSWAAYNAGPAKVARMRKLAEKMGRDPNRWFGHVELAAGKIVGRETVKYVKDIYKHYVAYRLLEQLQAGKAELKADA